MTLNGTDLKGILETDFRNIVRSDKKIRNAYLLVHSDKLGLHLDIAEGKTGESDASPLQSSHMASVGKLFTATVIGMLHDQGKLEYNDPISGFLDENVIRSLHIYKGHDYSHEITVRHLLTQTSGLNDVFFHMFEKITADTNYEVSLTEALEWGKVNLKPVGKPGQRLYYTDTNYYLLGMIIEKITGKTFHDVVHQMIFEPLGMVHSWINGFSVPSVKPIFPPAGIWLKGINCIDNHRLSIIDYAGGGVVAPMSELLLFMKSLVGGRLVKQETLTLMINDDTIMGFPTLAFKYGYSIWKPMRIPLLLPEKYFCWGCVGITGAFMFYHPRTESYIIGTFNDSSYTSKALKYMFNKVVGKLLKAES